MSGCADNRGRPNPFITTTIQLKSEWNDCHVVCPRRPLWCPWGIVSVESRTLSRLAQVVGYQAPVIGHYFTLDGISVIVVCVVETSQSLGKGICQDIRLAPARLTCLYRNTVFCSCAFKSLSALRIFSLPLAQPTLWISSTSSHTVCCSCHHAAVDVTCQLKTYSDCLALMCDKLVGT